MKKKVQTQKIKLEIENRESQMRIIEVNEIKHLDIELRYWISNQMK